MTQQDDITQRPLTGDETRAAVREARSMTAPSDTTEPGDYVMAGARALLSKLRAPVADERLGAQEYGSPADVAQRIEQYLAQDGRMNSGTQLLYEAMKALRASQGDRNDG